MPAKILEGRRHEREYGLRGRLRIKGEGRAFHSGGLLNNNNRRLQRRLKGVQVLQKKKNTKKTGQLYTFSLIFYYANSKKNLHAYEI